MASVSVLICCHGHLDWANLAWDRAYPSAFKQADECLVVYSKNGTLAEARNAAAMEAKGDWLVFLDADDELEVGYVDALKAQLQLDPAPEQLCAPRISYVESGYKQAPKYLPLGQNDIREGNWLVIGTAVHRATFDLAGGFREWPLYEDWDLWQRCHLRAEARPVKVPGMVYVAHVSHQSRNRGPSPALQSETYHAIRASNYGL